MKTITLLGVISGLVLTLVSTASASIDKNLKYGQRDPEVMELQEFLIDGGFLKGIPTNFFGLLTLKAVKVYQKSINLPPTGFVGVLTREKINKEIELEVASSNEAEQSEDSSTTNNQIVLNTNGTTTNNDSVYDSDIKIDEFGRKVTITQVPNYKFLNVVRAKLEVLKGQTINGFFYKDKKRFMSEADLAGQERLSQIEIDKLNGKYTPPVTDVCKNIEGMQTSVPTTMLADASGNCFFQPTLQQTTVTSITPQPVVVPIKLLQITSSNLTNFRVVSNKDLDFDKFTFIKEVFSTELTGNACRTNPNTNLRECADWSKTEILPIKVTSVEKENYGDIRQCYSNLCDIYQYNITISPSVTNFFDWHIRGEAGMAIKIKVSDKEGNTLTSKEATVFENQNTGIKTFNMETVYNP